jgi:hypothetical protein
MEVSLMRQPQLRQRPAKRKLRLQYITINQ